MRRQVGRITQGDGAVSGTGSGVGGIRMERTGSRESKMPSGSTASAFKRDSPIPGEASPGTSTPQARVPISRTPSTATVTQSKVTGSTRMQPPLQRALRGSSGSGRRPPPIATSAGQSPKDEYYEDAIEHEGPSESESEDEPPSAASRSQAFRRPLTSRRAKQTLGTLGSDGDAENDEDDEEDSDTHLPFATASKPADPSATLRSSPKRPTSKPVPVRENSTATSESSTERPPGPLSPRHRAQLNSTSPRGGSEGSPSMGSSFSDLEDASVTQSALEDALMSNMRTQGSYGSSIGGRMSSLREALGRRQGQ